jgi:hypothetical protein
MKTRPPSPIGTLRNMIVRFSGTLRIIARELSGELCRLNRLGIDRGNSGSSRRVSPRRIKALVAERYREPRSCC